MGHSFDVKMIQQSTGLVCFRFFPVQFDNSHGFECNNYCSLSAGFRGGRRKEANCSESVQFKDETICNGKVPDEKMNSTIHWKAAQVAGPATNATTKILIESILERTL